MDSYTIHYCLSSAQSGPRTIDVSIDRRTMGRVIDPQTKALPEWTRLECDQCGNCPLDSRQTAHCPMAVALVPLLELCEGLNSYDPLDVEVRLPERAVTASTTAQRAVSSLLGLMVATSDCPHTAFLRPMARFHLPFASEEETLYRATSMYLLAQYFRADAGKSADFTLQGLGRLYQDLQLINQAMAQRIRSASTHDSAVNAIVLLDLFARALPDEIDNTMDELRYLFDAFPDPSPPPGG